MEHNENGYMDAMEMMKPWTGSFEVTSDFTDWLKELKKTSINDIDVIGLHDKTTDKKREFVSIERVLEILDKSTAYAKELDETFADKADGMMAATSAIRKAVLALKEG